MKVLMKFGALHEWQTQIMIIEISITHIWIISLCSCMSNFCYINTVTLLCNTTYKSATFTENFYRQQINLNLIEFHFQNRKLFAFYECHRIVWQCWSYCSKQIIHYHIFYFSVKQILTKFSVYLFFMVPSPTHFVWQNLCQLHYSVFFSLSQNLFAKNTQAKMTLESLS